MDHTENIPLNLFVKIYSRGREPIQETAGTLQFVYPVAKNIDYG
jgi:hypothetical protein